MANRASTRWGTIQELDHPDAYLRRMVVNEYLSWRRKWARLIPSSDLLDERSDPGRDAVTDADADDRHHLQAELKKLPPRQRAVVVLRVYVGLNDAEIAATLHCPRGTVRSLQSRALHRLRVEMGPADRPVAPSTSAPRLVAGVDQPEHQES